VFIIIGAAITFIVRHETAGRRRKEATSIAEYGPRKGVPQSIEALEVAIAAYEDELERHVRDSAQTGVYWKILATRFRDKGMHLEALNALDHAMQYSPDEETLHYLSGLSAVQVAASRYLVPGEAERLFGVAEKAYLQAINLSPDYGQARYALAALYVLELDRAAEAIPHLERYMRLRSGDADAMFLMARAYYMVGRYNDAIDWYNRGIPVTKDKAKAAEAEANIQFIRSVGG
jgi:tetratricopeptide (TPR) repeat protein